MNACINCQYFYYSPPQIDQPYPEFSCVRGIWDGVSSKEQEADLSEENNCEDFKLKEDKQ